MKRIIQVPIDAEMLTKLDDVARARGVPRAEVIRSACLALLERLTQEELERRDRDGYTRFPEKPRLAEALARASAEALEPEDW